MMPLRFPQVRPAEPVRALVWLATWLLVAAFTLHPRTAAATPFLDYFTHVERIASTVPHNGDVNPYGITVVKRSVGSLQRGNVLVSNFNNSSNLQGTGTTIVQIAPDGTRSVFANLGNAGVASACPGGVGLTTALVALDSGWVIVGSLPAPTGLSASAAAGCLIVVDSDGRVAEVFAGNGINGPWDMTALDECDYAVLFVSNVLNGDVTTGSPHIVNQGTVLRIELSLPPQHMGVPLWLSATVIGSGFAETADPNALVIGPTGVALSWDGTLYVADTLKNRIAAIPQALTRTTSASTGYTFANGGALVGPLGIAFAPNGDLLAANAGDGSLVEFAPTGQQVAVKPVVIVNGAGSLLGIAVAPRGKGLYFVDDGDNTMKILTTP